MMNINESVDFIRELYGTNETIHLHEPQFLGNEKHYLNDVIESTFVSSVGEYIGKFEHLISNYTNSPAVVATANGTSAIHVALHSAGIGIGDLVITQSLSFVATCNAIRMTGADPIFVDISPDNLGLCPKSLEIFLDQNACINDSGECYLRNDDRCIRAVVPMHTFGHPVKIDEIIKICNKWNIIVVEDAAESLGSLYKDKHTGTFGLFGAMSFNGNKIITTGGGGAVLCKDKKNGDRIKHLTTTAKVPHSFKYFHDELGFNYRMPNVNAALGCAQIEKLHCYLGAKRKLALLYRDFYSGSEYKFLDEPLHANSNFWLNAIICPDMKSRDHFMSMSHREGIMTRPAWTPLHKLPMFKNCIRGNLPVTTFMEERVINLPSTPKLNNQDA
jgi:UDP-N-acetylbacillosamine transaminase